MKKILSALLILMVFASCNKKSTPKPTQNVVIDNPNALPEPKENPVDVEKKLNASGKIFGLRYLEGNKLKPKILNSKSKLIKGMTFDSELVTIETKNPKSQFAFFELKPKNEQKSSFRMAFYWDKKTNQCTLRTQFVQKAIAELKDPYPLLVNSKYCKKYFKIITK